MNHHNASEQALFISLGREYLERSESYSNHKQSLLLLLHHMCHNSKPVKQIVLDLSLPIRKLSSIAFSCK